MIFTKLLPVAVVESPVAFCFNVFPEKFSAPFSRFFLSPDPARLAFLVDFLCFVVFAPFPNHGAWYQLNTRGMIVKMNTVRQISLKPSSPE